MALHFIKECYKVNSLVQPLPINNQKILYHQDSGCIYLVGNYMHNPMNDPFYRFNIVLHSTLRLWKYNLARKTWTKLKSDNAPCILCSYFCVWLNKNQILLHGGVPTVEGSVPDLDNFNGTFIYDINTEQWTGLNITGSPWSEPDGDRFAGSMRSCEDEIFFVTPNLNSELPGGNLVHRLNLRTLTWEYLKEEGEIDTQIELNRLLRHRILHDVVIYGDDLLLIGGEENNDAGCYSMKSLPTFNVKERKWKLLVTKPDAASGKWPSPRVGQSCVQFGSKVYVCGGYCGLLQEDATLTEAFSEDTVLKDLWCLDLISATWTRLPADLPYTLCEHSITIDPETQIIYIFGGYTDPDSNEISDALFSISVKDSPQSLEHCCWQVLLRYYDNFSALPLSSSIDHSLNDIIPARLLKKLCC